MICNLNSIFSVGRPKHEKVMITTNEQDAYIGDIIVRKQFHFTDNRKNTRVY